MVPSISYAAFQDEVLPVIGGVAIGTLMLGWSIYRSSNDQRFETILARLDKAEKEVDDTLEKLKKVNHDNVDLRFKVDNVEGKYEQLKNRLITHTCPVFADPKTQCGLADIIKSTL